MPHAISIVSLVSICLSLLALGGAVYLPWRWRDWRLAFLTGLTALVAASEANALLRRSVEWPMPVFQDLSDFRALVLSAIVFFAVYFLNKIFDERRRVEDALRRSDTRFRDLIEGSIQGILILNRAWKPLFANHAIATVFGYSGPDEILALDDAAVLLAPTERARIKSISESRWNDDPMPETYELEGVRKDGARIWLQIHSRRVLWRDIQAIQSTVIDITELKKREAELNAAKELAEVANRTKSEFLANMSHELRTPLTAIIGFSEVLESEMFGPHANQAYKQYAADIRDSGAHLLEIINDILNVSKIEAGKVELHEETLAVAQLVESALTLVRERAEANAVTIDSAVQNSVLLMADPRLLKQILVNLLSNAVKFTPPGGRIDIGSTIASDGGFVLNVRDTGIGIAQEDLSKVMRPFSQADGTLARSHEGTGLGLPLARSLAELHDGTVTLTSEPGMGTTASLVLPAKRVLELQAAE